MQHVTGQLVLANTQRTIGLVLAALLAIAFVAYVLITMRIGRREAGAEVELAPNRKPYFDDETLETRKLDQSLVVGLILLLALGIGLPAYWLAEPGRQDGEKLHQIDQYYRRGERVYNEGAQCINCHGAEGVGGVVSYAITDADGNFVDQVTWQAPALDTIMYRYSREEITEILVYGRAGTPMPAWGIAGGGPLDAKAIDDVITYL
jgi:mono/diheme cytochrome c family protein